MISFQDHRVNEMVTVNLDSFPSEYTSLKEQADKVQTIYSNIDNEFTQDAGCLPNCDCHHCSKVIKAVCFGVGEGCVYGFVSTVICCLGPGSGAWIGAAQFGYPAGVIVGKALVGASATITSLTSVIGGCVAFKNLDKTI